MSLPWASLRRALVAGRHPASLLVLSSVSVQLMLVVTGPLIVRLVGVEERGELALAFCVVPFSAVLAMFGMPMALSYFAASRSIPAVAVLVATRRLVVRGGVLALCIAAAVLSAVDRIGQPFHDFPLVLAVVVVGAGGVYGTSMVTAALQGDQRFAAMAVCQLLRGVVGLAALLVLAVNGTRSGPLVLSCLVLGWLLSGLAASYVLVRSPVTGGSRRIPTHAEFRQYARVTGWASLAPIDGLFVDQLLVGLVAGHYQLGLYAIGLAFGSVPSFLLAAVAAYVGPRVAGKQGAERRRFVAHWMRIGAMVSVTIVLLLEVSLPVIVPLAFGGDARPAIATARILALAGAVLGIRRLGNAILANAGWGRITRASELTGALVMALAVGGLSMHGGSTGAACGLLLGAAVACCIQATAGRGRHGLARVMRRHASATPEHAENPREDPTSRP